MSDMFLHKCPNCNGTLEFNIESGMVTCSYCGSKFDVESLKTENGINNGVKPETANAQNSARPSGTDGISGAAQRPKEKVPTEFSWKEYKKHLKNESLEGTKSYLCQTCGAEVVLDAITASSQCPYCGNYLILTENVTAGLKPNGIIPFKILPDKLPAAVRKFYSGKKLLPFHFFDDNKLGKIRGIYVPFWLYSCSMKGGMTFKGNKVNSYVSGQYRYTETSSYSIERDAEMSFDRIPVDASLKMPNDLMDSIEPFDYSQLTEFNSGYLTGFVSDRFDSDPDENLPRVSERVNNSVVSLMKNSVTDYSSVEVSDNRMSMADPSVKYVMLPVYLFDCKYAGKEYHYAANGQTGKVVGELPVSKGKKWLYFGLPFLIVSALVFLFLRFFIGG